MRDHATVGGRVVVVFSFLLLAVAATRVSAQTTYSSNTTLSANTTVTNGFAVNNSATLSIAGER